MNPMHLSFQTLLNVNQFWEVQMDVQAEVHTNNCDTKILDGGSQFVTRIEQLMVCHCNTLMIFNHFLHKDTDWVRSGGKLCS